MVNYLNACKYGLQKYISKGAFGALQDKSTFDQSYEDTKVSNAFISLLIIVSIVYGFLAVNKICKSDSERSKNTRLGLYILLILSGGTVGWIYILIQLLKIDICA